MLEIQLVMFEILHVQCWIVLLSNIDTFVTILVFILPQYWKYLIQCWNVLKPI